MKIDAKLVGVRGCRTFVAIGAAALSRDGMGVVVRDRRSKHGKTASLVRQSIGQGIGRSVLSLAAAKPEAMALSPNSNSDINSSDYLIAIDVTNISSEASILRVLEMVQRPTPLQKGVPIQVRDAKAVSQETPVASHQQIGSSYLVDSD